MKINIKDAEKSLDQLVELLTNEEEEEIVLYKDEAPIAKMTLINANKRIGAAKEEMTTSISLEELNSILGDDFDCD